LSAFYIDLYQSKVLSKKKKKKKDRDRDNRHDPVTLAVTHQPADFLQKELTHRNPLLYKKSTKRGM